ncbi:putative copper-importing P-type ATPase A [Methanobrevibacter cuticularis]|uniref:Putative copper-importing P-type ATPase A n=1 Tax=Methanobrevibacter cuticularis TaxID=47311 RepID=A0A166ECB8_9EURY|nr:HAD family hydrolase [Methanobrevibacter cuticularis]KZX16500.1 putative copper-importing P-type ATPase A [Methanobrevibacter cuticularis]
MLKKAVVFDIAGTLIKRCRAVKNINTGKLSESGSLELVDKLGNSALVVMQIDTRKSIMKADPKEKLYDFLTNNAIDVDISYSSSNIRKNDILKKLKDNTVTMKEFQNVASYLKKKNNFIQLCSGSAFLFNVSNDEIEYIIAAGGQIFPHVACVIQTLKNQGIEPFIASGDRKESLHEIGKIINIPKENIFDTANTLRKEKIVVELKSRYKVMMVGNGPNDILAFKKADLSVLTLEQNEPISQSIIDEVDIVINNITELLDINF